LFLTGFGWAKPVEVDMRGFSHPRRDMALTSLAGPLSNLLMAFTVLFAIKLLPIMIPISEMSASIFTLVDILDIVISINLSLAVFNLLPVPPLDGSKIFGAILPKRLYYGMLRHQRVISTVMILALFLGVLNLPIGWLTGRAYTFIDAVTSPLEQLWRS
jgi:Zn-dependent protease